MADDLTQLPPIAASAIRRFLAPLDHAHPGLVEAVWLEGSIALGDYHPRVSDIDLVLLTSRATPERRRSVRPTVAVTWHTWDSLSTLATSSDLGAVSAATLHRHGIAVRGPKPATVVADVARTTLANAMRSNLEAYWRPWLLRARQGAGRILALHPRLIEWGTLGVPRQYVTIVEGEIASKSAAGRYVRGRWAPRWHRIVDEALRLRTGSPGRRYLSPFERRRDMLAFLEHAIEVTRALPPRSPPR